jgi:hypothetical protein
METMDKAQATEIHNHLLAIRDAINKTEAALFNAGQGRSRDIRRPYEQVMGRVAAHALQAVYDQYPELRPTPKDFDHLDTDLR